MKIIRSPEVRDDIQETLRTYRRLHWINAMRNYRPAVQRTLRKLARSPYLGSPPEANPPVNVLCYPVEDFERMLIYFNRYPDRGVLEVYRILARDAGDALLQREFG